jgi:hypothetical protein
MPQDPQQRRAELIAKIEQEIEILLAWEAQTAKPNMTQIEEVVLAARQRIGQTLAHNLVQAQADQLEQEAVLPTDPITNKKLHPKGKKNGNAKPD